MSQIEFKNVSKKYGQDSVALEEVSFGINDGEFVFLVGPSGAGKSTLVKLLIREILPSSGVVLFNDRDVGLIPQVELPSLRRKIGVVFQDFKVLKSKNVFENVAIALEVADSSDETIGNVVPNVLGLVGLSDKTERFPNQLSGGELQRLSIARALAHEPDVLIADEPTGMIDPGSSAEVMQVLDKINSLGTTVLMATHDFSIVDRMKRRVIRVENGRVISDKNEGKYNG